MKTETSTKQKAANSIKGDVIKSFIAVCGNEYFEGEKLFAGQMMGVMGFEKYAALLMTEDEVKEVCSKYPECKAMNVL